MTFNLCYVCRETGKKVKGRRVKNARRIELENGLNYSSSQMSKLYIYLGKNGVAPARVYPPKYVTNINGFKVRA